MEDTADRVSSIIIAALVAGFWVSSGVWLGHAYPDQGVLTTFLYAGLGAGIGKWILTRNTECGCVHTDPG